MVEQWGEVWQVNFAPEKTQAMVISRSPDASQAVSGELCFGGKCLPLQDYIKILGVCVDCSLHFDNHIAGIVHQTSLRVSALRRMADTLEPQSTLTLYKAQIRPCMEYAASPETYDHRGRRAAPSTTDITGTPPRRIGTSSLQRVSHLNPLRLQPHTAQRCTIDAARSDELVQVPRSRSSQHQRTYTARTSRLWNIFVAAHKWRGRHPSRLVVQ
ncbi:hypothetical protein E2C01_062190 [Portunus trituberculatus]|uniref:RNA-directed DNA polymerase from mobile element jockey n=1 Tax=Portunus trituberculatus TaxID=210409 RepID=A0A5B7H5T1_PORTR|nr:hypothetical protein [Portunus trituberculatus]